METRNTSQLEHALLLQKAGEALISAGSYDKGLAKFDELFALLGKDCPRDRRAKAEMWIAWVMLTRGDKRGSQLKFRHAAKLLAPYKEHYPREWIYLCSMIRTVEGRRASDVAADALRGLLRKAAAEAGVEKPLWDRRDFSDDAAKRWVADQNELSTLTLDALPGRNAFRRRVDKLYFGGIGNFQCASSALYYSTWADGAVHPTMMKLSGWNRIPKRVLGPKDYGEDVHFAGFSVGPSERYVVFALGKGGSDRMTLHIKDLRRNRVLKERIEDLHFFRVTWHDESSFYYVRDNKVMLHQIGTRTKYDTVEFEAPSNMYISPMTVRNRWLFVFGYLHGDPGVHYYRRKLNGKRWTHYKHIGGMHASYAWMTEKDVMYLRSFGDTNFGRLISYDMQTRRSRGALRLSPGWYLKHVARVSDEHVAVFASKRMRDALQVYSKGKRVRQLLLPPLTVAYQVGRANANEILMRMESPILPPTIYQICPASLSKDVRFESGIEFDSEAYEQKLHWATSFDGTRVPICVVSRKGVAISDAPIKMYVYGGFRKSQIPYHWDHYNAALLQVGCSLAFVGIRGGDELGHEWHDAAMHGRKDLPMRDTVAGAQYLSSVLGIPASRIGLEGGSNGGLVSAGALAMAPEAFGCAVITNPVIDVTSCSETYQSEYGHPVKHKSRILQYAPLELMKPASYPPVLVKINANDDRVPPSNGYRFVAKLQSMQQGDAPILLRVYEGAGHSGWTSGSTAGEDACLFFVQHLGLNTRR